MTVLAASDLSATLAGVIATVASCAALAWVCQRLRMVPIVGFLLVGVFVLRLPGGMGLIEVQPFAAEVAEIGVLLLLFSIGLEFSLERLGRIARLIFVGGGLQTLGTIGAVVGLLVLAGGRWNEAVFTGCLVALSSTAVVLKVLAARGENDTPRGAASLGVLLFQDLAVVGMALVIPLIGAKAAAEVTGAGAIPWALGKAAGVVVLALVGARKVVPWLLERVARARSQEVFLLSVVAICLGTAWLTSLAGVSVSLGAFLAGLVMSESRYREQAFAEIMPLQILFSAAFFVSIGLLLDLAYVRDHWPMVLATSLGVLVLKAAVTALAVRALRLPWRTALATGLVLAQIGEFSFVLQRLGAGVGLSPGSLGEGGGQLFLAVSVTLMLATPFLAQAAGALEDWMIGRPSASPAASAGKHSASAGLENHVIVAGMGATGSSLARVLRDSGVPLAVADLNPANVRRAEQDGLAAVFGDASRPAVLEAAGIRRAKLLVVAVNETRAIERTVQVARDLNPSLQIIARSRFLAELPAVQRAGADAVVPQELEASVEIFRRVLRAYLVGEGEIARHVEAIRAHGYAALGPAHAADRLVVCAGIGENCLNTRLLTVRAGSAADEKSLRELDLARAHRLTVRRVERGEAAWDPPPAGLTLQAGDRLAIYGRPEDFQRGGAIFTAARG